MSARKGTQKHQIELLEAKLAEASELLKTRLNRIRELEMQAHEASNKAVVFYKNGINRFRGDLELFAKLAEMKTDFDGEYIGKKGRVFQLILDRLKTLEETGYHE